MGTVVIWCCCRAVTKLVLTAAITLAKQDGFLLPFQLIFESHSVNPRQRLDDSGLTMGHVPDSANVDCCLSRYDLRSGDKMSVSDLLVSVFLPPE